MRRLLFVLASIIAVLTFSCDTTQPDFDDAVPNLNTLTTNVTPDDGGEVLPSEGEFVDGTAIEIEAIPNTGFLFERWEGDLVGSLNPTFLSMTNNRSVTAVFSEAEIPLTINIVGQGSVEQTIISQEADEAAVSVTPPIQTQPEDTLKIPPKGDDRLQLQQDGGDLIDESIPNRERQRTDIPDERVQSRDLTQENVQAQVRKAITTLRLTAVPDEGWQFSRWEGALTGSQNPDTVTVENETVITAVFEEEVANIFTLELDIQGQGFIEAVPDKLQYNQGEQVTLTARPDTGWQFSEWTGDLSGSQNPETIIMDANKQIGSVFTQVGSSQLQVVQQPSQTVAGEFISPAPSVQFLDADDNPVEGIEVSAALDSQSFSGSSTTTVVTNSSGVALFSELSIETIGNSYRIVFSASETDASSISTNQFAVIAGQSDAILIVSGNNQTAGVAGTLPNPVVVRVTDAFGNPVEGGTVSFEFDETPTAAIGQSAAPETAATDVSGEASSSITLGSAPGTYTISATIEGVAPVTFTADAQIGLPSIISILNQPSDAVAGETIAPAPSVEITDEEGNGVEGVIVNAVLENGTFAEGSILQSETDSDGNAQFASLRVTAAGTGYSIRFEPDASSLNNVTSELFDITSAAANPTSTTANVPNGSAGDLTEITISVQDEFGNPVVGIASDLSVSVTQGINTGATFAPITDDGTGTYQTSYTPSATGTDEIKIELNGAAIDGSPFTSVVIATDAENIEITNQPQNAVAGEVIGGSPSVLVTDDLGNPIGNVEVTVSIDGGTGISSGSTIVISNNSGIAVFDDLIIQDAGSYQLRFDALGVPADAVSNTIQITPAAADALVEISGDGQTATVNTALSNAFTVQITDAFGNPVQGEAVDFAVVTAPSGATGTSLSPESVITDISGNALSTLTLGSIAGSYTVSATSSVGSVQFTATAVAGGAVTFEFDPISSPQIAGNPFVIALTAFDANGNLATSYSGTATLSTTAGTVLPGSVTFSAGEASANVTVSEAGINQTLTVQDGTISGTSDAFNVESGGASQASVVQQPTETVAGQPISPAPSVLVVDSEGNPVGSVNVSVSANGESLAPESITASTTGSNGVAEFNNLIIETAGTNTLSFNIGAGITSVQSGTFEIVSAEGDPASTIASAGSGIAGESTQITITVEDAFGNRVTGSEGLLSINVTGANNANPIVTESGNGIYSATYTPISSGTDEIDIRLDGTPISGSPLISNVTTSQIDGNVSSVSASPSSVVVGSPSQVTVQLSDANGNAISGLGTEDFNITVTGNANAGTLGETSTAGTYLFNVSNTRAEQVTVSINVDGVSLADEPQITFTPGDPNLLVIISQPVNSVTGAVISGPPAVQVTDEFGNNVPGLDIDVTEQDGQNFASGTDRVATNNQGVAEFADLVITDVGRYNLVFSESSGLTVTSNAFNLIAENPDAAETTATVPNGAAGDATAITITVRDSFQNPVEGVAGQLVLSVSGANSGTAFTSIIDQGNGVYTTSYEPTSTGRDDISIQLGGVEIAGSPYPSDVITSNADSIVVIQDALETIAGENIAGPPTVEVLDDLGNPVRDVEVIASIQRSASFSSGNTSVNTNNSGIADFNNLVIESAGSYTLIFNAIGVTANVTSGPFNIIPAGADVVTLDSGNNQIGTVTGSLAEPLVVGVADEFGNPVQGVVVDFEVSGSPSGATGQSVGNAQASTDANGLAQTTLTLGDVTGTYEVRASVSGAGNVTFSAVANAAAASTFTFDSINSPQTAGQPFSIRIVALDSQGNTATGYQGTAALSTGTGSIIPVEANFANGIAALEVSLSAAGQNRSIVATDGSITGTSGTFDVQSGGVSASNSLVSVDPSSQQAGQTASIIIELRDGSNNLVSGLSGGDFTVTVSGNAQVGNVSEDAAGLYSADITNETAESVVVTVQANGITLNDTPTATFTAANAASVSLVSGNNQTGSVTQQLAADFVVNISDVFGNDVPGEEVQFAISSAPAGASGQNLSTGSVQTNSNGNASTRLTLGSTPGEYSVAATVSGAGSVLFTATAQTGAPSQMTIVTQPGNSPAGNAISPFPEIRISDNAGNAVSGASITVREEGGYNFDGGTITRTSNSSGIALFDDLIIETANQYVLVFDALASGVPDISSNSFTVNAGAGNPANTSATIPNGTAGQQTEISIDVKDEFNNAVGGASGNLSVVVSGANSATPVVSETAVTGTYTANYTPVNSGTDNISIEINSLGISGSPFTSDVTTSGISGTASSVGASPSSLQVGNSSTVSVLLRDDVGNAIGGLSGTEFTVDASGNATVGSVTETSTDGTYQFNVGNTTSQTVTVSVVVSGVALDDEPQIVFSAGSPADLRITTNPGNAIAGTSIPGPPSVIVEDQFENPVPNVSVSVNEQGGQSFASGTQSLLTNGSGIAAFDDLRIDVTGQYNLVFSSAGLNNQTSNAFDVSAALADAGQTTAAVPNGSAGVATGITITVNDAFGNSVTGVAGDLAVSVSGANAGATVDAITGNGDGTYTTGYTPTSTGGDTIVITLGGTAIQGSPFTSTVITSGAANVEVITQPLSTVAGQPIAGPPTAEVSDSETNPVPGIDVVASLTSGSFASGTSTVTSDGSGESVFNDLVITQAGSYTIDFNAQGVTNPATTASFDIVPAAATGLAITSGNNQTATVTQALASPLTVQVTDQFGNAVPGEDVNFAITATPTGATGQGISASTVPTDANGLAATSLTLGDVSGDYQVTASGVGFGSVVFTATAQPGAANTFTFDTITSPQVAGSPFEVTINALDNQGNIASGYNGTASLTSSAGSVSPSSAAFSNGNAVLDISVSNAGINQTITAEDGSLTGTSNAFDVQSGGVSAANSSVSASPLTLLAGQSSTLTIDLRDGSNNSINGVGAGSFGISLTGDATSGTVTEPTPGIYTTSITNQTAETVTAAVTVNGTLLNDSPQIEFNPAAADPIATTATVPNGAAGESTIVTVSVDDAFGNPVAGVAAQLIASVSAGPNAGASFTAITDNGNGTYTTGYTPLTIGTDEITITLGGTEISGSPYNSIVTTSDVSASNSGASASPVSVVVGNPSVVTVVVRDGSNNPIAGLSSSDFNVNTTGSALAGTINETATGGTYEFSVSNQVAESVTITITATGTTLDDTPSITYTAGAPDQITVSTQPSNVNAGVSIPGPPSVTLEDVFNNPVPSVDVTVSEQGGQSFASGTLTIQTDASGIADFSDLVITDVGQYNLVFNEPGGEAATSNAFDVSSAAADAAQTTAAVPNGSAGDATTLTVSVNDAFGNSVTGAAGDLLATVSGANSESLSTFTDNSDGTYTASYTPTATGDDTIVITLGGTAIQGSPFTSTVITSDADAVAVSTQPLQTVAGQVLAGPPTALVSDNLSNPVSGIDVVASLSSGSFASGTSTVTSDGSGESVFNDLVITQAGSYTIDFNAQGVTNPATTTSFDIVPAAATGLAITSGNNQTATVTQALASPLTVQVTDQFGNAVPGEDVNFAITTTPTGATGQGISASTVPTDANGLAATSLTLGNVSGDYQVTASGVGFGSVVFTATAQPGAATSFTFDTITSPQVAGGAFSISISARDSEDNLANSYSGTASLSTTAGAITPNSALFTNGTASVNVEVTDAGTGQTITATDVAITGTSNTFDVQSGGVSALNSTVTANPLTVDAGQSSTLTIDLRDGSNNIVGGVDAADISIALTGNATSGAINEPTPGTYTTSITNNTAETVTAAVTVIGTLLNDSPQIEFTAGPASNLTLISGDSQSGTVAEQLTADFVVEATDGLSNPVSGVQVDFAIDQVPVGATGQSLTNTQIQTGSLGRAFTRLTLGDIPGTYTVNATASGLGTITFTAQAQIGEASQMTVTTQPGETTAGTPISPSPAVTITDDAGNPINGVTVSVTEQGGYTFNGGTQSVLTNAVGVATFSDLLINTAGNYTLVFDADAPAVSDISSAPFDVIPAAGDPANSTANVPDGAAGDPTTITISVWDQFNNPVTGASGDLSVSFVAGPNSGSSFSAITENVIGTYTTSYTPTVTGTDEISITLNGTNVAGTTYFSTVETSDVSASNSTVSAAPGTLPAGTNSVVTVEVRDGSDNPITGLVSTDFSISVSSDGTAGPISETSTNGTYQFVLSNTTAEQVSVSVTATGTTLVDSPNITFTAAAADLMLITQQPLLSEAGQPIVGPPTVRITDEFGNRVPNVEVSTSEQSGQTFSAGSTAIINTNSQGLAIFDNIAIEQVGDYNLVFAVIGIINRTSNIFEVEASDPVAAQSTASVPNGSAGVRTQISITARDAFGNRVEGASSLIGVQVSGANNGSTLEGIFDSGNGLYTTAYTPSATGTDQVTITVDGAVVSGSSFSSVVTTSDADNIVLNQQPLETVAGNTIAGPPSVTVTDQFGNNVPGIEVTVRESGGADFDAGTLTATTDTNGEALFNDLQINTAGNYTLIFDAVGVELDATSNSFDVTTASADAGSTVASVTPGTAGQATEITVTVEDIYENRIDGVQGDLGVSVTAGPNVGALVSAIFDEGNGIYTASYTPEATGTDDITVTLSTVEISNSPVSSLVSAGAASTLEISQQPPITTVAGSLINPNPAITVRDAELNVVPGVDVTATLSTNGFTVASTVTETTDGSGVATFDNLIIDAAASGYTITFSTDAVGVSDVISDSFDITAAAASSIELESGNNQTGLINTQLSLPFTVRVVDSFGNPVSSENVTYTITDTPVGAAGQVLSATTATSTAPDGFASSTLTLGDLAGIYTVEASFNGVVVTFTANAN